MMWSEQGNSKTIFVAAWERQTELVKDVGEVMNAEAENLDKSHLCLLMDTICNWHAE